MKPIIQSKIHGNGVRGNCLQTSLACLLEIDPVQVPSFELMGKQEWKRNLLEWLASRNLKLERFTQDPCLPCHYLVIGLSENGNRHCVVGQNGRLAHDPDPAQKGLQTPQEFWVVSPFEAMQSI